MRSIDHLHQLATGLANCLKGDQKAKELFRDKILMLVASSCDSYEKDAAFKKDVQQLLQELDGKNL